MRAALNSLLTGIAAFGLKRWKPVIAVALLWVAASPFILRGLRLETDSASISSPDDPISQAYSRNLERFGESGPLVIRLDFPETPMGVVNDFTDSLVDSLRDWDDISHVEYRLFDPDDPVLAVAMLRAALVNSGPDTLPGFMARFDEKGLSRQLRKSRKRMITLEDPALRKMITQDVLGIYGLCLPWLASRMPSARFSFDQGYFDSADRTARLIYVYPEISAENAEYSLQIMARTRALVDELREVASGAESIRVQYTGKYAVAAECLPALTRDMLLITALAMISIFFLLMFVFRNVRALIIAFVPITISLITIFAIARLFFNPINYVSMAFAAIISGIGVDVMLHCTGRFYQLLKNRSAMETALRATMLDCGPPVIIGLTTTAAAFFCLLFARYQALQQFGMLAGLGLLATLWICLILFPVMVRAFAPKTSSTIKPSILQLFPRGIWSHLLSKPFVVLGIALAIFAGSIFTVRYFRFEMNLFTGLPDKMLSLDVAESVAETFGVAHIIGAQVVIQSENHRDALIAQKMVDEELAKQVRAEKISGFQSPSQYLEYPGEMQRAGAMRQMQGAHIGENRGLFLRLLDEYKFKASAEYVAYYRLMEDVAAPEDDAYEASIMENRAHPVLRKFIAVEADNLILQTYVWPLHDLHDPAIIGRITDRLQAVSLPEGVTLSTTGTYQMFEHISTMVRADFVRVSVISGVMILVFMTLVFRRFRLVCLAVAPVAIAIPLTLALFVLFDVSFTPMSIGFIAIIVGIGIDDAVHILVRVRTRGEAELPAILHEVGILLTLTTVSTMIGFGAMMISSFYTLYSTGLVIAVGVFLCLVFTMLVVPAGYVVARNRSVR